jgi:SAM-dependent methyltransferase
MKKRSEIGFRKYLEENGVKLRWDFENKESYLKSCEYYVEYYDKLYGEYISPDKDSNILEIGCSFGWFLYYLNKKGCKNTFGIDSDPEKIDYINRFGVCKAKNVDAFDFLKDKNDCYDLVVATYVLEHIPRHRIFKFLNLIYESLKKEGRIIVTVPNMESMLNLRIRYLDFTHELSFTVSSLLYVLYHSNFDDLKIRDTFITPRNEKRKRKYLEAVDFIKTLYNDLGVRPPLFFGEGLMCVGTKGDPL